MRSFSISIKNYPGKLSWWFRRELPNTLYTFLQIHFWRSLKTCTKDWCLFYGPGFENLTMIVMWTVQLFSYGNLLTMLLSLNKLGNSWQINFNVLHGSVVIWQISCFSCTLFPSILHLHNNKQNLKSENST